MRYGVFGGTFDPIHMGHLRTAEEMAYEMGLAKLFLVPAASPPHKNQISVSDIQHRLAMARLAVGDSSLLEVLDIEAKRSGPSYSVDTLRELISSLGKENDLYFILGLEAFFEIHTWKNYARLFELTHFVVVERKGFSFESVPEYLDSLGIGFSRDHDSGMLSFTSGKTLIHKRPTQMEISSTQIRRLVRDNASIRFLVPDQVMNYILEKGLYKRNENP